MTNIEDDLPLRLTKAEISALLRVGAAALDKREAKWSVGTMNALGTALGKLSNVAASEKKLVEDARARGKQP